MRASSAALQASTSSRVRHACAFTAASRCGRAPRSSRLLVQATSAKVKPSDLRDVAEMAARAGAEVIMAAVDKPRNIQSKGSIGDIVTDTDKAAEVACIKAIQATFPDHAILGEEGGILGDTSSDYLWCIDPLDGTCNFAHSYPGFCVSIGVLRHAVPMAGCVIEFTGGPGRWAQRVYAAGRNCGATRNGQPISVSRVKKLEDALVVTELCWYDELWPVMADMYKDFTMNSMGVRCSGAAAANLVHLAEGTIDSYWQFMLKPWDVAAGVCILEEAGGRVGTADGLAYSVFDRSLLATNDALFEPMMARFEGPMEKLHAAGVKLGTANVPSGYKVKSGAQLE